MTCPEDAQLRQSCHDPWKVNLSETRRGIQRTRKLGSTLGCKRDSASGLEQRGEPLKAAFPHHLSSSICTNRGPLPTKCPSHTVADTAYNAESGEEKGSHGRAPHLGREHLRGVVQSATDFQNFTPQGFPVLHRTPAEHHRGQSHPRVTSHAGSRGEKHRHGKG